MGDEGRERLRQSIDGGMYDEVVSWVVVLRGGRFGRGCEYLDGGREDQSMGPIVSAGTGAGHTGARRGWLVSVLIIEAEVCGIPTPIVDQRSNEMVEDSIVNWCLPNVD